MSPRFFADSPIALSRKLSFLYWQTLDYTLVSFCVSSIHITWLLKSSLSISRFFTIKAVYCKKPVEQTFASFIDFPAFFFFSFVLVAHFHAFYSIKVFKTFKTIKYEVMQIANQVLVSEYN